MPRWQNEVCGFQGNLRKEGCKGQSLSKSRENESPDVLRNIGGLGCWWSEDTQVATAGEEMSDKEATWVVAVRTEM